MNDLKEKIFSIYERTINRIDDVSEYREIKREDIRAILNKMHSDIEKVNKASKKE